MSEPLPYHDEPIKGGTKRTIMPRGDAMAKKRQMAREAAVMVSKSGKRYGRSDQQKIVNERYGEFREQHYKTGEV